MSVSGNIAHITIKPYLKLHMLDNADKLHIVSTTQLSMVPLVVETNFMFGGNYLVLAYAKISEIITIAKVTQYIKFIVITI